MKREAVVLDGIMLLWFVLTALSVLFVVWDIRSTPDADGHHVNGAEVLEERVDMATNIQTVVRLDHTTSSKGSGS